MIFELARWVNNPARDWKSIQPDTLQIAADHYHACHAASLYLEQEIDREDIDNKAQVIIDTIRSGALGARARMDITRFQDLSSHIDLRLIPGVPVPLLQMNSTIR